MIDPLLIDQLIEIGRIGDPTDPRAASLLAAVAPQDQINRLHWQTWDEVAESMTTDDLVVLVKGLMLAETVNRWIGGSVSSVIWTFKALQRRDHALADRVADWILPKTYNDYVPFGRVSRGARTAAEYHESMRRLGEATARYRRAVAEDEKRAALERQARSEQRKHSASARHDAVRKDFIERISRLSVDEQLRRLADDKEYSVEFYPTSIAGKATDVALATLPPELRLALLRKLKGRRRGPWRRLKQRLLATFRSDLWSQRTPWDRAPWS